MVKRIVPALLATALAACASTSGEYPSLAVRDAERVTGTLQPAEPYVPTAPTPEMLSTVGDLVVHAQQAYQAYLDKLDSVRQAALAARGAQPGSDAWARANVAIADLETERSRTMLPLADIDRLAVAAATAGGATDELEAAQKAVGEMVDSETAKIDQIWSALR